MNNCIICGELTTGSRGAAGLWWGRMCQPCKDAEDAAHEGRLAAFVAISEALDQKEKDSD